MTTTMIPPAPSVTRTANESVHVRHTGPFVHASDRRRDAIATRLTLRLSGVSDKAMSRAGECHRSTSNRWRTGAVDTATTHFRRHLRKFVAAGAMPAPLLIDAASEVWASTVRTWPVGELRRRLRDLHYAEHCAQTRVDRWQMMDLEGLPAECDDTVDEAILEHATRLVEIYAIRCELRLRKEVA